MRERERQRGKCKGESEREIGGGPVEMRLLAVFAGKDFALCVFFIV